MKPSAVCVWCGVEFEPTNLRGPIPKYCRPSHRQRAYEQRRIDRLVAEAEANCP